MKKTTTFPNWKKTAMSLLAFTLFFSFSNAQNPYLIQFQDEILDVQENIDSFQWNQMPESSKLDNGYIGWVQFYETPNQDIQDAFKDRNLQLIQYIPHRTYLFFFPETTSIQFLAESGVRAIIPVEGRFKMSQDLKNGNVSDHGVLGSNYLVTLVHHEMASTEFVINDLATKQISVLERYRDSNHIDLVIPNNCLEALSELPYVKWVEVIAIEGEPEDEDGRGLHRSNGLDTEMPAGWSFDGEGVGVLTRDQGPITMHQDFKGRLENIPPFNSGSHGTNVTGCIGGAGNIRPGVRGSASGATLKATGYNPTFTDAVTVNLITDGTVQITNSSYSDVCNGPYSAITRRVDQQIFDNPTVEHVFSAGNNNGANCGYGAGNQWGNITGGHKSAKNCVTVGATNENGAIVGFSSRGPARDGRIKPDISGHGSGVTTTHPGGTNGSSNYVTTQGTSFSAPYVAGVMAQLYQVYMEANGGNLPPSALVKAALLNCATDFGNVGPDFKFGWGIANGLRSGLLLDEGRYLSDDVSQGNTNIHTINIPSGTAQVRFMVYWSDVPAAVNATPALVNDLDLEVVDPSSNILLPYLLDHTPDPALLDLPAGNGPDHLNNMEQVVINAPASGDYDIEITGFNVPVGPQEYYIVYEIIEDNLTVTYPNGGEKWVANSVNRIHWDSVDTTDPFDIEYSDDNGASWNLLTTASATARNHSWATAGTGITADGDMLVRVTSGAFSDESDDKFNIVSLTSNLTLTQVCETEATFEWDEVAGAESYDLYLLGDMYMEIVGTSNTTNITIPIVDSEADMWFAIAANNTTDDWEGRRTDALFYTGGLLDCSLGIEGNDILSTVLVYPNPASNEFIVNLGVSADSDIEITVTNSLGQSIQKLTTSTTLTTVDISGYNTGLYFVSIKSDTQATTKKLLIN